jgi:hypothetical protein
MGPNNYTKAIAQDFETHQLSQTILGSDLSILPISLLESHNEKTPGRNQGSRTRSRDFPSLTVRIQDGLSSIGIR